MTSRNVLRGVAATKPGPVLLIHGGLGHADNWGLQIPSLAENHRR